MAIKSSNLTVIDDTRKILTPGVAGSGGVNAGMEGKFSDFHPKTVTTVTTNIDFAASSVQKITLTGNTTFTISNATVGRTALFVIDTSTSGYTPTFPATVKFPTTPTWSNNRHWHVHLSVVGTEVRATAVGFDEPGAVSSAFNNFNINAWNTQNIHFAGTGFPESWCFLKFSRDDSNNRIIVERAHGDSGAPGTYVDEYATYTGLTGISSVEVQYNVQSQSCVGDCTASNYTFGPTPASDGYASGTYYTVPADPGGIRFGWMAQANPNSVEEATTNANMGSSNPDFRIKIVCNEGTFYSTAEVQNITGIYQRAYIGTVAAK
jgi:hypothetical protein